MNDLVTQEQLATALRDQAEALVREFEVRISEMVLRSTIDSVGTDDSGREALVDQVNGYESALDGKSKTSMGRVEIAGHLIVPVAGEPTITLGDLRNAVYVPLASPRFRPSGGQPGDSAVYGLAKPDALGVAERAVAWLRADGSITIDSGLTKHIELNGGKKPIGRVDDEISPGKWQSLLVTLPTPPNPPNTKMLTIQYQGASAVGPPPGPPEPFQILLQVIIPPSVALVFNVPALGPLPQEVIEKGVIAAGAPRTTG